MTYFVLDDGTTLGLNNNLEIADSLVGTRFYIDFQYANVTNRTDSFDATINLLNIQQVVTKPILIVETKSQLDSMGVNKINPSWLWCSSHYLNIVYYVMGSNSLPHRVNLIENLIDPMELSGDTLVFELRHNSLNDPAYQQLRGVGSFDLSPFMEAAKDTVLKMKVYFYSFYQGTSSVYLSYDFSKDEINEFKQNNRQIKGINELKYDFLLVH